MLVCDISLIIPPSFQRLRPLKMVNIHLACPYEKRILPFLQKPRVPHEELRLMGQDSEFVSVHPQLASTLLNLVLETSSVIAPEAPIAAMQELAQLMHLGRYVLCQFH